MQTWSISYSADKYKPKNKKWLEGKMNFNVTSGVANFYNEDGEEIEKMRVRREEIFEDAALTLRRHVIEIGMLEKEEESVDDLFSKLNQELGIGKDSLDSDAVNKNKRSYPSQDKPISSVITKTKTQQPMAVRPQKRPTLVNTEHVEEEPVELYDVLYTRDKSKKVKTWLDGVMKLFSKRRIGEFYSEQGVLLYKKVFVGEIKDGELLDTADWVFEICGPRKEDDTKTVTHGASETVNILKKKKKRFEILYTKDKLKKGKKWMDGWIELNPVGGNVNFYTEESECFYKKIFKEGVIVEGAEVESGMYLIQIMDERIDKSISVHVGSTKADSKVKGQVAIIENLVASEEIPMTGRSESELLRLLGGSCNATDTITKSEGADEKENDEYLINIKSGCNKEKQPETKHDDSESDDLELLHNLLK